MRARNTRRAGIPDRARDLLGELDLSRVPHRCAPSSGQRRRWWLSGAVGGAVAAAATTYLLDPERGQARRTELAQRGGRRLRQTADTTRKVGKDAVQRTAGSAREAVPERDRPGDAVLLERVRADAIGPSAARNSAIVTTIDDGVVMVRGQVEATEQREDLLTRILAVDGVRDVVDLTHLPHEPAPTRT